MLFYRSTTSDYHHDGVLSPDMRPSTATLRVTWMLKCFVTGIALLGLAYWLIQIAGAQYLATLTSATLLSFLLVYIIWCLTVKRRHMPQSTESIGPSDPPEMPASSSHLSPTTLALNPAFKHYGVPPRDCSPPPSYDEVLRQMGAAAAAAAAAASSSSSTTHVVTPPLDVEPRDTISTYVETSVTNARLPSPAAEQIAFSLQETDQTTEIHPPPSTAVSVPAPTATPTATPDAETAHALSTDHIV